MKARLAFLSIMGVVSAFFAGELFLSMRENAADAEVRALNGIPPEETWFIQGSFSNPPAQRSVYQGPIGNPAAFLDPDAELSYRLKANLRALPGRLRVNGKSIYDVSYSTGRFGWRATPQAPNNRGGDVLFFGDSYVFGHGLNDAETIPARFAEFMKGAAYAHNFGVPGWGAQHTLRLLETNGEKSELMQRRPTRAFYILIKEHLARLAGERAESAGAPRYEVRDGKVSFAGHFPDSGAFGKLCGYSAICDWLRTQQRQKKILSGETSANSADLVAVLARIAEILHERYGIRLTVISWNPGDPSLEEVEKRLGAAGIDVVPAKNALPGFGGTSAEWAFPFDGHPNRAAAEKLAQYLADRLRG